MARIEEFLKHLGDSSEDVAASLEAMGIKGEKRNAQFCPVIKAIYQKFPTMVNGLCVGVLRRSAGYCRMGSYGNVWVEERVSVVITWNDCQTLDPQCPQPIAEFVADFDRGDYPHLVGLPMEEIKAAAIAKLTREELMSIRLN